MDIMELGAIGELVGGVAVIASLIYVGLQVRQSNQINRADSVRSFVRDYNVLLYKLAEYEDIMRRGSVDFDGMTKADQTKVHLLLLSQFMLGLGDSIASPDRADRLARFVDGAVASSLSTPGFKQWWGRFRGLPQVLAPEYVDHLERLAPNSIDMLEFMPWFVPDESKSEDV